MAATAITIPTKKPIVNLKRVISLEVNVSGDNVAACLSPKIYNKPKQKN